MKVSELTGAQLDYWVAKAEGLPLSAEWNLRGSEAIAVGTGAGDLRSYAPSRNWADGGPIIERNSEAIFLHAGYTDTWPTGTDLLPFLMRAYVDSKFGADVPLEESASVRN